VIGTILASMVIGLSTFYAIYVFLNEIVTRRRIIQRVKGDERRKEHEPEWFHKLGLAAIRDASGIEMTFSRWLLLSLLGVVLGLIIGVFIFKNWIVGILLALTFAAIPTWIIHYYALRYREKVAEGLIPAFETFYSEYTITRNIPKALDTTAKQAPEPAKSEFERMAKEIYSGMATEKVLNSFVQRMNNRWARLFCALILMRENKGSNIDQSLLNLISEQKRRQLETKKDRAELSQVRLVHLILTLSSIVLFVVNLFVRPDSYTFFTTGSGRWVMVFIVAALLVSLVIFMFMNRKEVD